ncbi:tudor domain-containing protein 15 [Engraulis encrasicolus]|uniref:tudor domain-containing protein 15 n=1 Tax=Engraulis encrasicolus TaxID=184585 RepID=UPI002FD20B45
MSPTPSSDLRSQDIPELAAPRPEWSVDIKLTHIDCNPADILVHFQGQYVSTCELDYNILRVEIQNAEKVRGPVDVGQLCLIEDHLTGHWYRGRVQNKQNNLYNVFLIDSGNVLTVGDDHLARASDELFMLSPKIVCGFFANVLPLDKGWTPEVGKFLSSLIGTVINGNVHALLPHKVLILEAPEITKDLSRQNMGRPVDTGTFLLLVEMLTEVPVRPDCEQMLIEHPTGNGLSFKPPRVQGVENILSCCGSQQTVGEKVMVRLSAAINSHVFYCQTLCKEEELQLMSDKLADLCESKKEFIKETSEGNLGLLCAVRGKDETWHRGYVQTLPVDSQVRVLFVDYGYSELVKVENICQLHPDFLDRPIMAFPCALSSLSDDDKTSKKEQCDLLMKGLLGSALSVKINDFDKEQNFYHVTLCSAEDVPEKKTEMIPDIAPETCKAHEDNSSSQLIPLRCTNETKIIPSTTMKEDFDIGVVFEGYAEYILSPTNFWVRTAKRNDDFETLMDLLADHISPLQQNEDVLENAVPGTLCLAMFEKDLHYYRAIITDTLENGVEVYFVDFGNTEKVPGWLIKKLPERFTCEPEFAINCSLAHVLPVEEVWTDTVTESFRKIISNKALKIQVVQKTNERLIVDLFENDSENGESISLLMTANNMAQYWTCKPTASSPVLKEQDLKRNAKTQGPKGSTMPGQEKLQKENVQPDKDSEENAKVTQNGPDMFKIQRFKVGEELNVRCCSFICPSEFWCQIENQTCVFDKLMDGMQVFYQMHNKPLSSSDLFCAIKLTEDDKWYRGYILSRKHINCQVFLVDFGIIREEMMTKLQALLPEFNLLVWQAFRCTLYNLIEPANGTTWSTEACQALKEFMSGKIVNLRCTIHAELNVKNIGLCNVVDLHTPSQQATTLLVSQGLAVQVNPPQPLIATAYPLSFMYSTFGITIGRKEEVYATYVASPWEIYCQLGRNTEIIEDLMDKVGKESQKSPCAQSDLVPGSLCIAKYSEDEHWYRSTSSPVFSNQFLNVFFVDFGNRQIVEKSDVKPLQLSATDVLMTPMQALRCCLVNVPRGEPLAEVNTWLENNILNKPVQATFVGKDSDGTFICDMFCDGAHVSAKIKEIIAAHEESERGPDSTKDGPHENQRDGQAVNRQNKRPQKSDSKKDRKWINAKAYNCPKNKANTAETIPSVKKTLQPQKQKQEYVSQPQNKKQDQMTRPQSERKEQSLQPLQQNQERVHRTGSCAVALPKLSSLPVAKAKPGFVGVGFSSYVEPSNKFFIQMQEDETDILKMGEDLNDPSFKEKAENITAKVQNGDLVAAEFSEDGALYRAVITDDSKEGHLTIEFIDYGNTAIVEQSQLYRLTSEFLSQPRLCTPCTLVETHALVNHSSFGDVLKDKPFDVEFLRHTGTHWEVDLKEIQHPITSEHATEMEEEATEPSKKSSEACQSEAVVKHKQDTEVQCLKENERKRQEVNLFDSQPVSRTTKVVCSSHVKKSRLRKRRTQNNMQKRITGKRSTMTNNPPGLVTGNSQSFETRPASRETSIPELAHVRNALCLSNDQWHNLLAKDRSSASLQVTRGMAEEGTLLSVLDNGDLYVRLGCGDAQLTALQSLIAETEPECHFVPVNDVKEGLRCLTKSQRNNQWCRAVVSHVSIKEGKCTVQCLDYGGTEVASVKSIKALRDDIRQIPVHAVHCRWNGCGEPVTELKDILSPLVGQNIRLLFESYSDALQLWYVAILINEFFIHQQRAKSHHAREERKTPLTSSDVNLSAHMEPIGEHEQPRKLSMCPVQIGQEYSGFVTAATNPGDFYIALDDQDQNMITNAVSGTLESLPDLRPLPDAHVIPGTGCLIKYKDANQLCRAEILHVDSASILMNLVDYGVCTHILRENQVQLKILPEKLARLPKIIYPCVVRGIKPVKDGQWSDQAVLFFQESISHKNLKIIFRQCVLETKWEVDVLIDGGCLGKALVDAGHALYFERTLGLGFEQQHCQRSTEESVTDTNQTTTSDTQSNQIFKDANLQQTGERNTSVFNEDTKDKELLWNMHASKESWKNGVAPNSMKKLTDIPAGVKQCALQ